MKIFLSALIVSAFLSAPGKFQPAPADAQRIVGSIMSGGQALSTLGDLTDHFGPRVTGSDTYNGAVQWAANKFRSYGISNVRSEQFSLPQQWQRGSASGQVIAPLPRQLHIQAFGWSPATPPNGLRGEIVLLDDISEQSVKNNADKIRAKIILIDTKKIFAGQEHSYRNYMDYQALPGRVKGQGAIAILATGNMPNDVISTGALNWLGELEELPLADIGLEDGRAIERELEKGPVTVELNLQPRALGPEQVKDVVAEIRGRERPDEWILIGAHLDSWDFATGAQDNGAGVAQVLEAARAIAAVGHPPKRSIRFALWGGEEQGLMGSFAYARDHAPEMDKCVAVLNTDNGAGHPKGWKTENRQDVRKALEPISKSVLSQLGADEVSDEIGFDTDQGPFMLQGVPALDFLVDDGDYKEVHHKLADTLDKVDDHNLSDGAAAIALTAWTLADSTEQFAPRLDHNAEDKVLKKDGLDEFLRFNGFWK